MNVLNAAVRATGRSPISCGAADADFLELVVDVGMGGGVDALDVVPFVVEGGGVGAGEISSFDGGMPSATVGD